MKSDADPKVDYAFKKIFGSESNVDLLEDLVNAVLQPPPETRFVGLQIRNPFNAKETSEDKLSILDIKATDASGRIFNIEMQMLALRYFKERSLYYWARVYSGQLEEGRDYSELCPTITICFVNGQLFPKRSDYHHRFVLSDPATGQVLTNHLKMHFVELPKFALTAEQLQTPFDVWCYFLRHGESLDSASLPAQLDVPSIHRALEVLYVMTQSEAERERYEARLKGLRDLSSERKAGLQEGKLMAQIRFCQRVLKQPQTPEEELENLSAEELAQLAVELEQQAFPPGS